MIDDSNYGDGYEAGYLAGLETARNEIVKRIGELTDVVTGGHRRQMQEAGIDPDAVHEWEDHDDCCYGPGGCKGPCPDHPPVPLPPRTHLSNPPGVSQGIPQWIGPDWSQYLPIDHENSDPINWWDNPRRRWAQMEAWLDEAGLRAVPKGEGDPAA